MLAGAQVSTRTSSSEDVGIITVQASEVELAGVARFADGQPVLNQRGLTTPASLSTFSRSDGRSGSLNIETDRLTVQDGATIQTSTQGSGDAGNLRIRAHESVELVGTIGSSQSSTALLTLSGGIPNLPFSGNQERSGLSAIHEGMFKQAVAEAYFKAIGEADSGW